MLALSPDTLSDKFDCPYDVWIEHFWWDRWWVCPYVVNVKGTFGVYTTCFRTKWVARWYTRRMVKRINKGVRG